MGLKGRILRLRRQVRGRASVRELREMFLSNATRLRALADGEEPCEPEHPRVTEIRNSPDHGLRDTFFAPVEIEQKEVEDLSEEEA